MISNMHTNQRILVNALINAGYAIEVLDPEQELIKVYRGAEQHLILDRTSCKMSLLAAHLSASKYYTKQALTNAGLNTPKGKLFNLRDAAQYQEAIVYGMTLRSCVVKPNYGSHADNIHLNIEHKEHLSCVFDTLLSQNIGSCVVEEYIPFNEYRVFITEKGKYACVHRQAARVTGDGINNVESLILKENQIRIDLKAKVYTSLCPIVANDDEAYYCLTQQGKTFFTVPAKGEVVHIRRHSNLAKGGRAIDMTNKVSKEFVSIAFKALKSIEGLNVAGVDILCQDPTVSNPVYAILEVNSNPGLAMHAYPDEGVPQPVGEYLLDVLI